MSEEQGLFSTLGISLSDFRAAVEGEPGTELKSMGADQGVLPDIVRATIQGLADVLVWLHRMSEDIEDRVISGDAAVALFEVGGNTLDSLGEEIQLGPLATNAAVPADALAGVNTLLQSATAVIDIAQKLARSIIPTVEDILVIQNQLTSLLGERHAAPTEPPGSLTQLMNQIGIG